MTKSNALGLLALAVTSSLALAQDGGWSAKPGSGLKYDGGDAFGLKLANRIQIHYVYRADESSADSSNFNIRRARTTLSGHVFNKNIEYVLMLDATDSSEFELNEPTPGAFELDGASDSPLKQGHVTWNFINSDSGKIGLRIGQAKSMFGLEWTGTSAGLTFVERSTASGVFSNDYTRGAWLNGKYADSKLRWSLGAMNGVTLGEEASNDDNELGYVGSVNFDPLGDFFGGSQTAESWRQVDLREGDRPLIGTIGIGMAIDNTVDAGIDVETEILNINTAWSVQGFQIMGEWFDVSESQTGSPDSDADGFTLSASYALPKSGDSSIQWAFGLRYSLVDLTDAGLNEQSDISLVANAFYHGHACKTQIELTQREYDGTGASDDTDYIISLAFQLMF